MDIDTVILSQSAQFYKPREGVFFNDLNIKEILDTASSNKKLEADFLIDKFRAAHRCNGINCKVSIRVFLTEKKVFFLDDSQLKDQIYAFIVLIEVNDYLVILKKSCSSFKTTLERYFRNIEYKKMVDMIGNTSSFKKLSLRNMSISNKALRSRSYEASDLIGVLSTHSAGSSIPYYFKIAEKGSVKSVTTSSSRVTEYSTRKTLDEIVFWANEQTKFLDQGRTNNFLKTFAKPIEIAQVLEISNPSAILIETDALFDALREEDSEIFHINKDSKVIAKITPRLYDILKRKLSKVYEIENDVVKGVRSTKINRNKGTLSFDSFPLHRFKIKKEDKLDSLQRYIINKGLFTICFDDPKYMYYMNFCFENVSGISEINSILEIFSPTQDLQKATTEKGEVKSNSTSFDENSVFSIVENIYINEDYLFCDDLGTEWADHISFNSSNPSINFIHSKYGKESTSASNLHEVVGQAIKNLGNMYFSPEGFINQKKAKFIKKYKDSKSCIARVRRGDLKLVKEYLINIQKRPQLYRNCILVCSFLSYQELKTNFNKIQKKEKVRGHIMQLLWIISSFVHATKEMNIIPKIICKP
ncbi:hypothetical protein [Legionella longbeachae]|uniref:Uncharacterized protein n=1 Tax=Legionella longbeachae serogroup 1 (strain NSW150) TaxID=661367 RepID=D3HSW1_LEGLN|nr:hypothetical protein [Legionella longbeachae]VEE02492.1 Uncharacterised protein [Legionella oakridgensis]ARB91235.1 hypothetical protein A6J40_03095 [Legionella longbeachae]EEZ93442.1 conserved hypothetical protein [Legionella longbeachae D-4968]QIN32342.1 hypothetical protein GCB94_09375 [Legionella longbeachae]QIN35688.1 hypothetical protein GCS73_08615 [Legionella longbeachae]